MARSKTPAAPHVPSKQLTPSEIEKGLARLRTRLAELEAFDPSGIREKRPPELVALSTGIEAALSKTFGDKTSEYYRYLEASDLLWSPAIFIGGYETPLSDYRDAMTNRVKNARILLKEAIRSLEEDLADGLPVTPAKAGLSAPALSKRVFVVHGHDEAAKEKVARFLTKIGFDPIILHEQANAGQTVIEKFEKHGDVGFAVVLLTPDDVGGAKGKDMQPRARQNVILELGYFMGRLGRSHVCALKAGDLEVPSDFAGVVYEAMDPAGAWQAALGRELQEAGHEIDWNKVMRS